MTTPEDPAGSARGSDRLPDEVVADLLGDEACRRLLACLADRGEPTAVEDLARAVVARERGVDETAIEDSTVSERRDEVFQRHLPKLTSTGVVAYDSLLGTVALDTRDERIRSALE